MSYKIAGQYDLYIKIGDVEFNPIESNVLKINIFESVGQFLPALEIELFDSGRFVEEVPLRDWMPIQIALTTRRATVNEEDWMPFRLFNYKMDQFETEGYNLYLSCIFDAPDILRSRIESIDGPSSKVFSTLAARSGLLSNIDNTIDRQVWLRGGQRGGVWLNDVCNAAWANNSSCFTWCVRRNRTMVLANLNERAKRRRDWVMVPLRSGPDVQLEEDELTYLDPQYKTMSGSLNTVYGYGRDRSSFDFMSGEHAEFEARTFAKSTRNIQIDPTRLQSQRTDLVSINAGNTHENYEKARIQNLRYKSIYSTSVRLLTETIRDIQLLDRVELQIYDEYAERLRDTYSGDYFISNIVTQITLEQVTRTVGLLREGINPEVPVNLI